MEVPGHFTFRKDGTGHFLFGLVQGEMDCRLEDMGGKMGERSFGWNKVPPMVQVKILRTTIIENRDLTY